MNHKRWPIQILTGLVVFATLGLTQLLGAYAGGVLYVAPSGNDANSCVTLSTACLTITAAVSKAVSGDTIVIAAGTYVESPQIGKNLTLIGFGADATIIDQGQIYVSKATVNIFDLAITHGGGGTGGDGGALFNDMGAVTLGYASIISSHAGTGGGIYNYRGTLILDHSIVANNSVVRDGGGIYNGVGKVSISHSTIMSNTACNTNCLYLAGRELTVTRPLTGFNSFGGGIVNDSGLMTIDTSAIISNSTVFGGGDGIYNIGPLYITNSTVSANAGYGLWNLSTVTLTNVTLNENVLIGLRNDGGTQLKNTIIANTTGGGNCLGSIVSLGHNLSSDNSCALNASGDLINTNPLLGPLQNNGGTTLTHALLPSSPAINAGANSGCPATDQRGIVRPQAGVCDIGAYEYVFPDRFFLPLVSR